MHRAFSICSSWGAFDVEIKRIRQLLVNNNFPINVVDNTINKVLSNKVNPENSQKQNSIIIYYRNQYTSNFKSEETNLKNAIKKNVQPSDTTKKVEVRIYYKNRKLKSLFIKNKLFHKKTDDHVVYQYRCNKIGCNSNSYIGYTTMKLATRFYSHAQTGAIREHNKNIHDAKPLTQELLSNTTILFKSSSKQDLTIAESLLIKLNKPYFNLQDEGFNRVLNIF